MKDPKQELNKDFESLIRNIHTVFASILRKKDLGNSKLRKELEVSVKNLEMVASMPDYSEYVDKGRRPGKMPPVDDILEWMRDNRISVSGIPNRSLAFAISNSIANKGIKARPFVEEFTDQIVLLMERQLSESINKSLQNI